MDVSKLVIPKCRGIVIECGYEAPNQIDKINNFVSHVKVEPKQPTYFKFDQVTQLKKMTGLPIIVRGIMNPLDAMAAAGAGASAVWVTGNFSGGASPISVMR